MTRSQWDSLCTKGQWDIMSAMRGPDYVHSHMLKWYTTAVLRGQMEEVFRVGGLVNRILPFIVVPSEASIFIPPPFDSSHFFTHVKEAAAWMGVMCYKVDASLYRDVLAFSSVTQGWELLWKGEGSRKGLNKFLTEEVNKSIMEKFANATL